jgi:hypothetical protein
MIQVKHGFVSQVADGTNPAKVQPSHWNSDHQVQMEGPGLLGRVSGTGEVQKITLGANLTFSGTSLVATSGGGSSGGAELGSSIPSNLGTAAAGISLLAAREDHVHNLPTLEILGAAPFSHEHSISNVTGLQTALDGKAALVHGHDISNITDLQSTLDSKANTSHIHTISNITGLQTALDGKAASVHGHAISNITDLQSTLDSKATSIQGTKADTAVQPADLTKAAVGLSNVDNTSDLNKPISSATQTALNGKAPTSHLHVFADITGLVGALEQKSSVGHSHVTADITDINQYLDEKDLYIQSLNMPVATILNGTEGVPIIQNDTSKLTTVDGILARSGVMVSTKNIEGEWTGMAMPGGGASNDLIVIGAAEPDNEDGRPNGTIYIKVT